MIDRSKFFVAVLAGLAVFVAFGLSAESTNDPVPTNSEVQELISEHKENVELLNSIDFRLFREENLAALEELVNTNKEGLKVAEYSDIQGEAVEPTSLQTERADKN